MATVAKYGPDSLTDAAGNVLTDVDINVYESDGVTAAAIYSDRTLTTPITQPFTPDSAGNVEFYVGVDGEYIVVVSDNGTEKGRFHVELGFGVSEHEAASDPHTQYLAKTGGTLTGDLTLPGNPSALLHATTKEYVDTQVAGSGSGETILTSRVQLSADFDALGGGWRLIPFNSEIYDDIGEWDSVNYRLTSVNGGVYSFEVFLTYIVNSELYLSLYRNGVESRRLAYLPNGAYTLNTNESATLKLAAGDYIDVRVYGSAGNVMQANTGTPRTTAVHVAKLS